MDEDQFESHPVNKTNEGLKDPELWFKSRFIQNEDGGITGYVSINYEYTGALKNFKAHGSGRLVCTDGYTYDGEFQRSKISGNGKLLAKGHVMEGDFDNGCLIEGSHTLPNGTVYRGRPGSGCQWSGPSIRIQYADGRDFEGEVLRGSPHGRGRMSFAAVPGCPPAFYEGEFCRGVRHGRGALTLSNGDVIDGEFADGVFAGPGTMRSSDGCGILEASSWIDGSPDGPGTLRFPGGSRYTGEFRKGEVAGQGRLEHPAESASEPGMLTYEGEFANGRAHGAGVLTVGGLGGRVDARLAGDWREGLPHGRGLLEEPHGKRGDLRPIAGTDYVSGERQGVFSYSGNESATGSVAMEEEDLVASRVQRS